MENKLPNMGVISWKKDTCRSVLLLICGLEMLFSGYPLFDLYIVCVFDSDSAILRVHDSRILGLALYG